MVKIRIVCVGKIKEKYFAEAAAEYAKRISRFAEVSVREIKEENFTTDPSPAEAQRIIELEGAGIEKELRGHTVCLAVEGKKLSSEALSEKLKGLADSGAGE
ncbi:MAG: 23S rRNA (pseudouridine(1915)-N(3))-methyltransferase RlmH, partial [Clostridia bacterium]|nr:23S rRNA (pseudouridine(1915)-N(3))-methyltransferase RlmH [Clostridia bacterium]